MGGGGGGLVLEDESHKRVPLATGVVAWGLARVLER